MEPTAQQLEKLKQLELELLARFIDVCNRLELRYFLLGGTLLGAVRHQGFIPWDDDIDVGMPRADYEKFLAQGQAYMPEGFFIQSFITDPEYPANFAKIRNSNTTFLESSMRNCKINHGVYIDVFPLDHYPDQSVKRFELKKLLLTLRISYALVSPNMKMRTRLVRPVTRMLWPSIEKAVYKREDLFRSVSTGKKIANHCGAWGKKEIVPAHWYGDGVTLRFEGVEVTAPAEYDKWLTQVYGDYMQLPPPEKRKGHHYTDVIDLEKPYTCYMLR